MKDGEMNWKDDPRLVAYALGEWAELGDADVAEIETALADDASCRAALDELRAFLPKLESALAAPASPAPSGSQSAPFVLGREARAEIGLAARRGAPKAHGWRMPALVAAAVCGTLGASVMLLKDRDRGSGVDVRVAGASDDASESQAPQAEAAPVGGLDGFVRSDVAYADVAVAEEAQEQFEGSAMKIESVAAEVESPDQGGRTAPSTDARAARKRAAPRAAAPAEAKRGRGAPQESLTLGKARAEASNAKDSLGMAPAAPSAGQAPVLERKVYRGPGDSTLPGGAAPTMSPPEIPVGPGTPVRAPRLVIERTLGSDLTELAQAQPAPENPFVEVSEDDTSTFSIDVDTASYSAARAALGRGVRPVPDQVRIEEFLNYFTYDDAPPAPNDPHPFAVSADVGAAPWAPEHRLVRIGLTTRQPEFVARGSANLVLLLDVSGSMNRPHKLPLVKKALGLLTEALLPTDQVAIAVYAGSEGLVLDTRPVAQRELILQSLERLGAGGSTNAGAGIELAYAVAREHFIEGGINRVVLCTDGDFNVGATSEAALEELIARQAEDGVELSVLGFGADGSSKGDARMEALSNRGNGNYAAIDSELEARKVLASELGGTLQTVAKDVKIQVSWNKAAVKAFRLIGYENRLLAHQDFLDDTKDAGEIGAGHGVTALYEVVPADGAPLAAGTALMDVRLRYKRPGEAQSVGFGGQIFDGGASFDGAPRDLRFAASVAAFAMVLRGSEHIGATGLDDVRRWALEAMGPDPGGLREGFVQLVEKAIALEAPGDEEDR